MTVSRVAASAEEVPLGAGGGLWMTAGREARMLAARQRGTLCLAATLLVVNRLASLSVPVIGKLAVDRVAAPGELDGLVRIAALAGGVMVVQASSGLTLERLMGATAGRVVGAIRRDIHARAIRLPLNTLHHIPPGRLLSSITTDADQLGTVLAVGLVPLASSVVTAGGALVLLASVSRVAVILAVPGMVVAALCLGRGFARFGAAFAAVGATNAALTARLAETLGSVATVKSCGAERQETHGFARATHRHVRAFATATRAAAALGAGSTLATGVAGAVLLGAGGHAVQAGWWTLGDLTLVALLVGLLVAPVAHVAAMTREIGEAVTILGRLSALRHLPTEQEEDRWRLPVRPRGFGRVIRVERIRHVYPSGHVALRDVSFTAERGSTIALVGRSGSGKSTVCRLLAGFDQPTRGRIVVDGRDLTTLRRCDYRAHLGVVLQDEPLFTGTIADNIRYGRPCAGLAEVRQAAGQAQCQEFIDQLPCGYDTLIGPSGTTLSAGQRQRIALARALLANPRILLLDEITSHLDGETEQQVLQAVARRREDCLTVIVAHRLVTVRDADQILLFEAGRIVEQGTHETLLACHGRYYWLYTTQQPDARDELPGSSRPWSEDAIASSPWRADVDWGMTS